MDDDVQAVPLLAERLESTGDFIITADVTGNTESGIAFGGHLFDPAGEFLVLVGKGEDGPLPVHGLCDAPGDGAVAGEADDQRAFAVQESHSVS